MNNRPREGGTFFTAMGAVVRPLRLGDEGAPVHVLLLDEEELEPGHAPVTTYHQFVSDDREGPAHANVPPVTQDVLVTIHRQYAALPDGMKAAVSRWLLENAPRDQAKHALAVAEGRTVDPRAALSACHLLYSALPGDARSDIVSFYLLRTGSPFLVEGALELRARVLRGFAYWLVRGSGGLADVTAVVADATTQAPNGSRRAATTRFADRWRTFRGTWERPQQVPWPVDPLTDSLRLLVPNEKPQGRIQAYVIAPVFVYGCLVGVSFAVLEYRGGESPVELAEFCEGHYATGDALARLAARELSDAVQVYRAAEFDGRTEHDLGTTPLPRAQEVTRVFEKHAHLLVRPGGARAHGPAESIEVISGSVRALAAAVDDEGEVPGDPAGRFKLNARKMVRRQVLATKLGRLETFRFAVDAAAATKGLIGLRDLRHDLEHDFFDVLEDPAATDVEKQRAVEWIRVLAVALLADLGGVTSRIRLTSRVADEPLLETLRKAIKCRAELAGEEALPDHVPAEFISLMRHLFLNLKNRSGSRIVLARDALGYFAISSRSPAVPLADCNRLCETLRAASLPRSHHELHGMDFTLAALRRLGSRHLAVRWEFFAGAALRPTVTLILDDEGVRNLDGTAQVFEADSYEVAFSASGLELE